MLYSFLEYGLLGDLTHYPSTGNRYNFRYNFLFVVGATMLMGLLQGCIEVVWFRKRFAQKALWEKIILKSLFYLLFIIVFLAGFGTLNRLIMFNDGSMSDALFDLERFIDNFAFWSLIMYIGTTLGIALFFAEISQYIGDGVLLNFFFGKYHRPKRETRIFMFLDMKSSTTIAERLGHVKYFDLLKAYYADMTHAILDTAGEIYQYVGDEIVVSWSEKGGVYRNNCIRCFALISQVLERKKESYLDQFGLVPEFKAGYHIGEVTTGEIGIIKKDIIYTGDVLNTTARIQEECNTYGAKALISGKLLEALQKEDPITFTQIGTLTLRGKTEAIQLYSVVF